MSREPLPPPDPEAFLAELVKAWTPGSYTEAERYADFRALFLGSQRGKRVLYQLLFWAHMWHTSYTKGDPIEMAFKEGARNLGLQLMTAMNKEPKSQRPTRQVTTRPKGENDGG